MQYRNIFIQTDLDSDSRNSENSCLKFCQNLNCAEDLAWRCRSRILLPDRLKYEFLAEHTSIRDLSRIRLDPNLLQNQFMFTRSSKLCSPQDVQSWKAIGWWLEEKYCLSSVWKSLGIADCQPKRCNITGCALYQPNKDKRDWLSERCPKLVHGSLFSSKIDVWVSIFVCMWWEGASCVPRSQRYLQPCVTCVTMGDHPPSPLCPMWESLICGRQHQYMGVIDKWDREE